MHFKPISTALILLTEFSHPALADAGQTTDIVACDLSAWTTDEDPNGLNVRSGPGTGFGVIATLPPPITEDGTDYFPEVHITGSKDGWFRIDSALTDLYDFESDNDEATVAFEGEGWVSGRYLALLLNDTNLYSEPSRDSDLAARLMNEDHYGPDAFIVERMLGCTGDWAHVDGDFDGTHYTGWASWTCASQITTCP